MHYLLYNGNSTNTVLFILSRHGYTLNYPKVSISLLLSGHPYKILIDTNKKSYYVVAYNQNIHYLTGVGFIISSGTIIYANNKGEIKGYLRGCLDSPKDGNFYQVKKIFVPTPYCFKLSDYKKMDVAWPKVKNKVVKKTVSEIEEELGLEPGTLEIQQ